MHSKQYLNFKKKIWKCNFCYRLFAQKVPHRCRGTMRKKNLSFSLRRDVLRKIGAVERWLVNF